jgi:hypothetical protein
MCRVDLPLCWPCIVNRMKRPITRSLSLKYFHSRCIHAIILCTCVSSRLHVLNDSHSSTTNPDYTKTPPAVAIALKLPYPVFKYLYPARFKPPSVYVFSATHVLEDTWTPSPHTLQFNPSTKGILVEGTMFGFGPGSNDTNQMLYRVLQKSLNTWCVTCCL